MGKLQGSERLFLTNIQIADLEEYIFDPNTWEVETMDLWVWD